ncbi:hypothetical protein D3C71_1602110 [compost metagenome]
MGRTAFIFLAVYLTLELNGSRQVLGQRVNNRNAYTVETAGYFITFAAEFAAGMQHRKHNLKSGAFGFFLFTDRNTTAVIDDRYAVVLMDNDINFVAITGQGLVNAVVDDFPHQVMQAAGAGGADIHTGPLAHRFKAFQHLNLVLVVRIGVDGHGPFTYFSCFNSFIRSRISDARAF